MTETYQVYSIPGVAEVSAGNGRKGAAQGVTGRDYTVGRIRGFCTADRGHDLGFDAVPGFEESLVGGTAGANGPRNHDEIGVGEEIANGSRASERHHDQLVGVVERHEPCSVGDPNAIRTVS